MRRRIHRRADQRGASTVLLAVLMSAILMVSAAFAVDLGQQRVVRRDMQAVADVVALDLARMLQGKTVASYSAAERTAFDTAFRNSVDRNTDALGGALDADDPSEIRWEFVTKSGDDWTALAKWGSTEVPDAVRVVAHSGTGSAFGGVTGIGDLEATRDGVATLDPQLCFSAGANLLDLDTGDNVLVQALETFLGINLLDVSTSVVGPAGIVSLQEAKVPLLDLSAALGIGTVGGLVTTTEPITVGELLDASAEVLNQQGDLASLNAALILDALTANAGLSTPTLLISDILSLGPSPTTALDAEVSVMDLVNASLYVAGEHALGASVPLSVPGVGVVNAEAAVIEIPKIVCARPTDSPRTEATSAQIAVTATVGLGATTLITDLLTGLNNLLADLLAALLSTQEERIKPGSLAADLVIDVTSAQTTAWLRTPGGIECDAVAGQRAELEVATSLASVDVGLRLRYVVQRRTRPAPLLAWGAWSDIRTVDAEILGLGAVVGDDSPVPATLEFLPPPEEQMPVFTTTTPLALALQVTASDQTAITAIVGSLVNPVLNILVNPLINNLNAGLLPALDDTLGALGIELGTTTVAASGRPACAPRLIG